MDGNAPHDQENFEPHPLLRNPHVATAVVACWQRTACELAVTEGLFGGGTGDPASCEMPLAASAKATYVYDFGDS